MDKPAGTVRQAGDVFLLGEEQIGEAEETACRFGRASGNLLPQGAVSIDSARMWRRCIGNPLLLFATSAAFAEPLLETDRERNRAASHVCSSSSQANLPCWLWLHRCGVAGGPSRRLMRATDKRLRASPALYADTLPPLDEITECDPRIIDQAIYMLGNGSGKLNIH